jgi:hypothetical protein
VLAFVLVGTIWAPSAHGSVAGQSRTPIRAANGWKHEVIDPGPVVYPKLVYVIGSPVGVQNIRGLKARGGGATTITSAGVGEKGVGDTALILDLGANVGGYVEIGVRASNGTPIRLGYSELPEYLTPRGIQRTDRHPASATTPTAEPTSSRPPRRRSSAPPRSEKRSASSLCSSRAPGPRRSTTSASTPSTSDRALPDTAVPSCPATIGSTASGTRAPTHLLSTRSGTCARDIRPSRRW